MSISNEEYQNMVFDLAKPGQTIIDELTPQSMHLLHMAIGVAGEVAELIDATDLDNVLEEFGDIEFYLEGFALFAPVERPTQSNPPKQAVPELVIAAGDLLDACKRSSIYADPICITTLVKCLHRVHIAVNTMYDLYPPHINIETAKQRNFKKLGKRYEDHKYSNNAAIERADKK